MTDQRCGTYAGVIAHVRRKEKVCEPCRIARNNYRNAKRLPRIYEPIIREKCGTTAGYKAHEANGEKTCDPCRLAINERVRFRNQKVKGIRADRSRQYRANNTEHVRAVESNYRLRFPEKKRAKDMRRLARKKGAIQVESITPEEVIALYGANCHICKKEIDLSLPRHAKDSKWGLHIDHVLALANGGQHTMENVRPAHAFCNLSKGIKKMGEVA